MTSDHTSVITGSLRAFLLFEIAEEVDVLELRRTLGLGAVRREPAFRHPVPEYVKFERPPVIEHLPNSRSTRDEELEIRIRYFDYGVASVELRLPFSTGWDGLTNLAQDWILASDLESRAESLLRSRIGAIRPVLKKPYERWISEDYYIIQLDPVCLDQARVISAETLLADHGSEIGQIVRGESGPLSQTELQDILQASMSYYPTDLLVVGWVAAFVYDDQTAAEPTIELLEYANTQLLEFRYYDDVLTRVLADVYRKLDRKHRLTARWALAREAENLNTIRLDYRELSERTENAIKFLSDMFYARVYRLAAARIGVNDYRNLVTSKLETARDLYESMVSDFNERRAFLLELMVVIILVIEIAFLFRGKG